jgi:hypothetical protein
MDQIGSDAVAYAYSGILAATEFIVGENRFPFALIAVDGAELTESIVTVKFFSLNQDEPQFKVELPATWRETVGTTPHVHDDGHVHLHINSRGAYVINSVTFDEPGYWGTSFTVDDAELGQPEIQGMVFEVMRNSPTPKTGETVPPINNLTITDVNDFSDISSRVMEDDMHQYSVAQALSLGKPFVVLFSTPMFCISRMCGPVTDVAAGMHAKYRDRVPFIHIEPYDLKIAREEGRLVTVEAMQAWNLVSEPWLFVIDKDGRVFQRFEGLVSTEELELTLAEILRIN